MKYNYVIFGSPEDYYQVAYNELNDKRYAYCLMKGIDSKNEILQFLFKIHTSKTTQKIINLPFKNIWNPFLFRHTFSDDKPICFFFFSRNPICNKETIIYLKNRFPNSKFVAYWQDLVSKIRMDNFELLRDKYLDLCLSFDQGDCQKYGLEYYPLVYSPFKVIDDNIRQSDVYFVGRAKDRLKQILEAYELFVDSGLKCDFNITGVDKKDRVYADSINYCNSMPYLENLAHIQATNCMLEIMQGGGSGFTLRYAEAIMYDKKMISNNTEIVNAAFYDPEKILCFKQTGEIDPLFPRRKPIKVDYNYKENLYPSKMLLFVDKSLSKEQ